MATNNLAGKVHGGSRIGGNVISAKGGSPKGNPGGSVVRRNGGGNTSGIYVYDGKQTVGYQRDSGTDTSRYTPRQPTGYVTTRSQAQGQAGK